MASTLESSVIQVEAQREQPRLTPELQTSTQEDEEELIPLNHPPTLSITEEILEFINQSRAREGLAAFRSSSTDERPSTQTNFSCPLPPLTSSPDLRLPTQHEVDRDITSQHLTRESETSALEVQVNPHELCSVEHAAEELEEVAKEEEDEQRPGSGEEKHTLSPTPTPDLHPSISVGLTDKEVSSSSSPDLLRHPLQERLPPARSSHLTKKDKKIIEKIRSYYEAAAEAEEDEAEEEEELREEALARRRSSFSQIPSGLVKDSVSRFTVGGHQEEPESTKPGLDAGEKESPDSNDPICSPASLPAGPESHEEVDEDEAISSLDLEATESPKSEEIQDTKSQSQAELNLQSVSNQAPDEEAAVQDRRNVGKDSMEGRPADETSAGGHMDQDGDPEKEESVAQLRSSEEAVTRTQPIISAATKNQAEPSTPPPPHKQCRKDPEGSETKNRDLAKPSGNLDGLPCQIKVGRWSRHSRIVSANRALFESMASNITDFGLFEVNPVVDPVLIENSERILSKVQTLAHMYSAKASTMKVPLHQKRDGAVQNQSWVSARLSGNLTLNQNPTPVQSQKQDQEAELKSGTQTSAETKAEIQNTTEPGQLSDGTHSQNCTQTRTQEDHRTVEDWTKSTENLTDDFQSAAPCDPQLNQVNRFSLSRPRDFISAMTQDRDSSAEDIPTSTSTGPGENESTEMSSAYSESARQPEGLGPACPSSSREADLVSAEAEALQRPDHLDRDPGHSTSANIWQAVDLEPRFSARGVPQWNVCRSEGEDVAPALHGPEDQDGDLKVSARSSAEDGTLGKKLWMRGTSSQSPGPAGTLLEDEGSPWSAHPRPPSLQVVDFLPTFTSQRPTDLLTALGKRASSDSWTGTEERELRKPTEASGSPKCTPFSGMTSLRERPNPASGSSAFKPNLSHRSPSPLRAPPTSSARASPCPSPFRVIPAPSPVPGSTSLALSCLSPVRAQPTPSPTPPSCSSTGRSSSSRVGPPASTTASHSHHSLPCLSPTASTSSFTRSLAASCISQSISQSMAKNNSRLTSPIDTDTQSPSSTHLRRRSPSPKFPPDHQGTSASAYAQLGFSKDGHHHLRNTPSSLRSSCPSPSLITSPPISLSQRCPSPSVSLAHRQPLYSPSPSPSPRPSFLHSKSDSSHNTNNNNNASSAVSNGGWSSGPQRALLANGSINAMTTHQTPNHLWSPSHNRVARPFSASEPSSRVQSPSPSPPTSFTRLCSPPPQHNYSSPLANKPPHPRSTRVGGASTQNPLGLSLELPRASSATSGFGTSSCVSPQILSPPPIGVPIWTNNVATPQPRNPRYTSSSPSFPSTLGSPLQEISSFVPGSSSLSGSCPPSSLTIRRSLPSGLGETPSSPGRSSANVLRRSWVDTSRSSKGSFDQQESGPISPTSGWSSHGSSPSCLSPRSGLQFPPSPSRFAPGQGTLGGQHFTSVPWPDVRELSSKYGGANSPEASATSNIIASSPVPMSPPHHTCLTSPVPSDASTDWGDPEPEEGNCRSQLICAYVARPPPEKQLSSSCLVFSNSGMTSPPSFHYQPDNLQSHVQRQPQVTTTPLIPSTPPPLPSGASPLSFTLSSPTKQGNQKTSYATTVNLQIAGSGRITSFSTAQVSLTQTLQAGTGSGGPGQGPGVRRVSINGLSPVAQTCNRI